MRCSITRSAACAALAALCAFTASAADAPVAAPAMEASAALPAGAREWIYTLDGARALELRTSAGTVRVVVGADDRVRVLGGYRDRADAPLVRYAVRRGVGSLEVRGRDEVNLVVEVPRELALAVRMSAGELGIERLDGDLDVRLRAGRVTIDAADLAAYADIDVSVTSGEIVWSAANVRRGGLFRSYDRSGPGATQLRVRVLAGSVDIV